MNIILMRSLSLVLILTCILFNTVVIAKNRSESPTICTRESGPIGITAASWVNPEQAHTALAESGLRRVQFVTHDGKFLVAHIYRPSHFDSTNGPIWFVMHGIKRNADYYAEIAAPVAERYQAMTIVIEFSRRYYPASEDYTLGITSSGRVGSRAILEDRYLKPEAYLYNEVERVFEAVRQTLGSNQQGYYLFGHSAGAQFTHRLLTFVPCARVLDAIAANAGWYTLPIEDERKNFGMPYSLRGSPTESYNLRALLSAPLTLLLGTQDIKESDEDRNVRNKPATIAQGVNRLARGHHYFRIGESLARSLGIPFAWQLVLAPGAEHDVQQIIASAGYLMFDRAKEPSCTPSTTEEAKQLVFNEILLEVPIIRNGKASQNGHSPPEQEPFVEIVNTGKTPICLTGWTLEGKDKKAKHLFPLDKALAPGKALVVFNEGIPIGDFGGSIIQRSTSISGLSLDFLGGILTLRDSKKQIAKQFSWGNCGGVACSADYWRGNPQIAGSISRWPDANGQWRPHSEISKTPMSPGLKSNGDRW